MKKLLVILLLIGINYSKVYSQATCAGAAPFCTASGTTFPASTGTTAPVGPNYGCLGSEPNPAFYYLQISTAGTININLSNSAGVDIDFCSWGPFATQAAMCPGISGSPFDCSYSTAATEQVNITGAVVGQWYMVMITNYANVPTNISATTAGGTTGATNCAILCNMTGLTAVPGACNPATNLYTITGTITTTTPPSTGTLTITNSCGGSTVLSPPFSTSIAYSFPGMTSNGAGCSITATYSADPTCTLTTAYTAPASCTGCTATATNTGPYCAGATIQLNSTGGGTYSWSGPGAYTSTLQNPTRPASTVAMSGTYTVTVTNGATTCTAVTTVTVNPLPVVTAEPNLTYCAGNAIPANTFASTPVGATYTWTNSNTTIGLAASGTTSLPAFTAINATAGPITSTITVTPTLTGCPGTPITFTITVNPNPTVTVNSSTICAGATATLTAAGGTSYVWSTGAVINPISVTPATTTSYTVTGTTGACTNSAIATVTVNPLPVVTAEVNLTYCAGAAVPANTFASTPAGATYTWTNSNTTIGLAASGTTSLPAFTATNATGAPITSTITITPTLTGCPGTPITFTITVNPIPVTTVNSPTICPGGTATLTAAGATTYSWSTGAVTNPINVTPATTTSYTVTGTSLTCTSTAVATVTVGASISPTVNSPTICAGATATLTATGGTTYTWSTGAVINPINVTPATTTSYTVTATTGTCTGTAVATVTVNPLPVTTVSSPTVCAGVTATPTAAGATTYSWSTGAVTNPISVTPAATTSYTVTGTSLGCTSTAVSTVTVNPIPVTTVNSPSICPGGTATLTAAGATTYSWSTGAVTNPINVTPATTTSYTVTGTSLTCTSTAVATVTVGAAIVPTVNSPTICAGATATLTATGGTTYAWSTGAVINPINVTPATTTSYTVTATTGTCTGTAVATVTVNPLPVTTVSSPTVCAGVTATPTAAGATTYSWSTGAVTNPISVTPATTTSYTVTGTSLGCTSTAVSTVTVNPIPVTTSTSTSVCPTISGTITAGGATTYSWSTGAVTPAITVTPAATTSYTVTGTSLGCSSTAVGTVTVNALLIVNAGLDDSVCFGMSTTLGVTPNGAGYSYAWTPSATLSGAGAIFNPIASPTATTTYSVTVTDPSGCTGTDNVTIFADPQITMAIAGIDVTCNGACNGQTIVIPAGGTPAYTYSWTSGCTAASCTGLCPGTYTVTVTDSWGCTASGNATVIQPTLLTATTPSSTPATCNGVCDGTATAAAAGGTIGAGYSYSWNTVPVQTTATATNLCAGSYTCTVTDANGCTATTTVTITEPTLVVTAPIAAVTICNGGTTTLTASASGGNPGGYTYTWLPAGTGATPSVTVSPLTTTTYTVNAIDVLHSCPAAPVTVTVTVNPPLAVVAAGTASICPGASTNISAIASLGGGGPYTYTWAPAFTGTGSPVTVSPAVTTTYTVTANDGCSPAVTATVTVTVLPLPVVNFTANNLSGCEPLCVTFTDNSTVTGGAIATWAWTFDGTTSSVATPTHCFNTPGSYTVGLTVTSSLGGCISSATNTNMITVYPNPVAAFTAPAATSIINPVVNFTDNSTNATSWHWNFGDPFATTDSVSNLQNPAHTYPTEGTYCVTLTVVSINGCTDNTQLCVVIDPEFTFFIPNAFSPNGDGINDEFFGKGDNINDFEMSVFDRWGNLIFFSDDINKHWDGKANHGKDMAQQDVYVYVVKIKDFKNTKHKYTGTVTIVK